MNIGELVEELLKMDQTIPLFLQADQEGNGYEEVRGVDDLACFMKDGHQYEVYDTQWSADDACLDEEEWEEIKKNRCAVIFP